MSIVSMRGIVKSFGGTRAVDGVDFTVEPGEVHALLGGNGAGKSTLIKVLAGVHAADRGTVHVHGQPVDPVRERLPIAFIHQDLALVEWMTVAENIALAAGYTRRGRLIHWSALDRQARAALDQIGCPLDPQARGVDLSQSDKSIVAIARALATEAAAIVLDEPTASLPESEVARLFAVLDRLRRAGRGMVYVSHRLDEIFRVADRVTVMRDGRLVATRPTAQTTPAELVEMIVGRTPPRPPPRPATVRERPLLQLAGLHAGAAGPVDVTVYPGEIVGFAGLRGAGQDTVGRAICGALPVTAGSMALDGQAVRPRSPAEAVRHGIAFVSSKRQEESLALTLSVRENLFVNPAVEGRGTFAPMRPAREAALAEARLRAVGARPLVTEPAIHTFSGGNQQKVVLARWLGGGLRLLVLEEPTMGVDVGPKADIYALLGRHAASGGAAIVVSTDLEEVAAVCDRAAIFDRGTVRTELGRDGLSVPALIAAVGGGAVGGGAAGESAHA